MNEENISSSEPAGQKSLGGKIFSAILFIVLLPIFIIAFLVQIIWTAILYIAIWVVWSPRGRSVLFVYSDSPIWKDYLEQDIFPRIEKQAIFLNWSERNHWTKTLAVLAFRHFGGTRKYNPMAIVFLPFRVQKSFRFYEAFKDFKHGNTDSVERMKQKLFAYLGIIEVK